MVEIRAADVGWVHPDGLPWDADFSPPDLYVEFGLPDDACLTSYVPDSFTPAWYEGCEFYVPDDPLFFLDLWDVDGAVDVLATGYTWDGAAAFTELARTSGTEPGFVDSSGTVTTWIELWPY
jgi:hypothetical protein